MERVVIFKETVKHHGKYRDPPDHQGIRNGQTTNHLHKDPC